MSHFFTNSQDTTYTIQRWKKWRTNKHGLGLAQSARKEKFVTLFCCFLCICGLSRACIRAKFPHSQQERWHILAHWPPRPLGPQVFAPRLAVSFLWLLLTALSCWLPSSVLRVGPLESDWHSPTPTPTETNAQHRATDTQSLFCC